MKNDQNVSLLVLIILFLITSGCASPPCMCKRSTVKNLTDSCFSAKEENYSSGLLNTLKEEGVNTSFRFGAYIRKEIPYFIFVNKQSEILLLNLLDSNEIIRNPLPFLPQVGASYLVQSFKDSILMVDTDNSILYKLFVTNGFKIEKVSELNFKKLTKKTALAIQTHGTQFFYNFPYLYLPYWSMEGKIHLDKNSTLRLNIQKEEVDKFLPFPDCYSNCFFYSENVNITSNGSALYATFMHMNQMVKYENDQRKEILLPTNHSFVEFDETKLQNLAYVRQSGAKNEINTNLILLQDQSLLLIRRLPKKELTGPSQFIYFKIKNDKIICSGNLDESIFSTMVLPFKNGILTIDDKLTKTIYYAFQ